MTHLSPLTTEMILAPLFKQEMQIARIVANKVQSTFVQQPWLTSWQRAKIQSIRVVMPNCYEFSASEAALCSRFSPSAIESLYTESSDFFVASLRLEILIAENLSFRTQNSQYQFLFGAAYVPLYNTVFVSFSELLSVRHGSSWNQVFASLGATLGHEMTHSIDSAGRQYEATGRFVRDYETRSEHYTSPQLQRLESNLEHQYAQRIESRQIAEKRAWNVALSRSRHQSGRFGRLAHWLHLRVHRLVHWRQVRQRDAMKRKERILMRGAIQTVSTSRLDENLADNIGLLVAFQASPIHNDFERQHWYRSRACRWCYNASAMPPFIPTGEWQFGSQLYSSMSDRIDVPTSNLQRQFTHRILNSQDQQQQEAQ